MEAGIGNVLAHELSKIQKRTEGRAVEFHPRTLEDAQKTVDSVTARHAQGIPPTVSEEVVEKKGPFGFYSSVEKRVDVKKAMAGESVNRQKEYEEAVPIGTPERVVDRAAYHIVTDVTHLTQTRPAETEAFRFLLSTIQKALTEKEKSRVIPGGSEEPAVRINNTRAVMHLVVRGFLGQTQYRQIAIDSREDIEKAWQAYLHGSHETATYTQSRLPSEEYIDEAVLAPRIRESIAKDRGHSAISVPIFFGFGYTSYNQLFYRNIADGSLNVRFTGTQKGVATESYSG